MWSLYKQEKSLRKVADIIGGISHDTVRRYLTKAGYDTNSVNLRVINDTQSIQCRIRVEDEELLRSLLDSGYLLGTMSGQILIAVKEYCDRLKSTRAKAS